jgi:hypothetical protein
MDRTLKDGDIGDLWSYSTVRFWLEVRKCALRCKECHKKKTSAEASVEHGGGLTGKRNCYCDLCAPLKKAYMGAWHKAHVKD